ncbi:unnamed protein product [Spirodela intermedia]|uniref:Uncharacterized protein n=1 Tax=Spirodela intermedia TaxID=51605 RepID=A0A7I8JKZ8_SPIIN|nr:unnamed protein product [Spirodela intermedia]CAA6670856.1 unnamed protein product [Spirodela intermedia]
MVHFCSLINQAHLKLLGLLQVNCWLMLCIPSLDLAHNAIQSNVLSCVHCHFIPEPTLHSSNDVSTQRPKDHDEKHRAPVFSDKLHNFEGMAFVFLGSMRGIRVGVNLALAIALHNIPEGVAVALPVYFATQSKWQAFKLATYSGFAEPLGVIIVAYLFPRSLSPEILEGLLASVGGVMAFLTLHEMLPLAFDYAGQKQAVKAVFLGMAFMSASLYFLQISLPEEINL